MMDSHPRQGVEAIDFVVIGLLVLFMALVAIFSARLPEPKTPAVAYATATVAYLVMVRLLVMLRASDTASLIVRSIALYLVFYYVYIHFDLVIEFINPFRAETSLMAIDRVMFGGRSPNVMLQSWLNPVAVDVFQVAYFMYYPLFLSVAAMLAWGEHQRFAAYLTSVALVFSLAFVGYLAVPARSPYVAMGLPDLSAAVGLTQPVVGGPVGMFIRDWIHGVEAFKFDCFPSGHTAGAVLVFLAMFSWKRVAGYVVAPICAALVFSTVYLQYHYVIDVIAGIALAVVVFLLGRLFVRHLPYGMNKGG